MERHSRTCYRERAILCVGQSVFEAQGTSEQSGSAGAPGKRKSTQEAQERPGSFGQSVFEAQGTSESDSVRWPKRF